MLNPELTVGTVHGYTFKAAVWYASLLLVLTCLIFFTFKTRVT